MEWDEELEWSRYILGVRDAKLKQWGDEGTLLALSGVTGRPVITVTGGLGKKPVIVEYCPPEGWFMSEITGAPIVLIHQKDHHFMPAKIKEGGEWEWVRLWEKETGALENCSLKEETESQECAKEENYKMDLEKPHQRAESVSVGCNFPFLQQPSENTRSSMMKSNGHKMVERYVMDVDGSDAGAAAESVPVGCNSLFLQQPSKSTGSAMSLDCRVDSFPTVKQGAEKRLFARACSLSSLQPLRRSTGPVYGGGVGTMWWEVDVNGMGDGQ